MSVYELDTGIAEDQRGEQFTLDDWPHSRALLAEGTAYGEYRRDDPGWNQRVRDQLDEWGWQTWIALPLAVEARSVGLIEVVDYQSDERWSPPRHRLLPDDRRPGRDGRAKRAAA